MSNNRHVVCIGEVLWDGLSDGLFLGGAPLNVCLNLHQLHIPVQIISRVGDDRLGTEALNRIEQTSVSTRYIQRDHLHETGFVEVRVDEDGAAGYTFVEPCAWDFISLEEKSTKTLLSQADTVVFGSLAQRQNLNLGNLLQLNCTKVLDMNLRAPYYTQERILKLVKGADIIKMNEEEMELVQRWSGMPDENTKSFLQQIASTYDCSSICVTCGAGGAMMWHEGTYFEHSGYAITTADTVGAGDAFLAALLYGFRLSMEREKLLPFANAAGAYVASRKGANTRYSVAELKSMMELSVE